MNFLNEGVFVNPSRADPGLVKVTNSAYKIKQGEKLVMRNGPAASVSHAVFVSVIAVEDVKLREPVFLSGGGSDRKQKWVSGCLFHGESELKTGFLGEALKYGSAYVAKESGADSFTSRMSLPSTSSPVRRSRFTEQVSSNPSNSSAPAVSSYSNWPLSLPHDSQGQSR